MLSEIACYDCFDSKQRVDKRPKHRSEPHITGHNVQTLASTVSVTRQYQGKHYPNSLEPMALVESFVNHPPQGFRTRLINTAQGMAPAFSAPFDILTTLDESENAITNALRSSKFIKRFCTLPTLFAGTTVSEYALYPHANDYSELIVGLFNEMRLSRSQLLIIKDIPLESPLIDDRGNISASRLAHQCKQAGFSLLTGQALAYVPIDFATIDEYLATRLSHSRRKEFRKKLKSKAELEILELRTGDPIFGDRFLIDELYRMYLNVYEQSKYHFDRLSKEFFVETLNDARNDGVVFVYKRGGCIIGYNLCFVYNNYLVDKYVGFEYPAARDSNLYFVSWFTNLEYAIKHKLAYYVAGWTDPEVKTALGASFTLTQHAVYVRNPILRGVVQKFQRFFEPDANFLDRSSGK